MPELRITNVNAISLDGGIGNASDESDEQRSAYGFTNKDDKDHVHSLLETADVVITGANSLKAARKAWEVKNAKGKMVQWFVFSNHGIPEDLEFLDQIQIEKHLISQKPIKNFPQKTNLKNLSYENQHPAEFLYQYLKSIKVEHALLFGGGSINKIFFEKNLVDEINVTICPIILASTSLAHYVAPGLSSPIQLELASSIKNGNLVFLRYNVKK